jgi:uncharacterized protein (TIGR03437 family)
VKRTGSLVGVIDRRVGTVFFPSGDNPALYSVGMDKSAWWTRACAVLLLCVVTVIASHAQTFTTLTSFSSNHFSVAPPIQGLDGNFYGVMGPTGPPQGGANGYGTIFKMTPAGVLTTLHSFNGIDGSDPQAGLVQGSDGNLYGTTYAGGANGYGTIFKITPVGALTTLHNFNGADGANPSSTLIQAAGGDFYGTTYAGGGNGYGTVFKISPGGMLSTLHSFDSNGIEGINPIPGLIQSTDGNFYGTTIVGGANGFGTIFKITATGTVTTMYSFGGTDGGYPEAGLLQGADGNFYGTTSEGGTSNNCLVGGLVGCGTLFRITPTGALTTLHSFDSTDGSYSVAPLIQGTDGNFYGTTQGGGLYDHGTIFEFSGLTLTTVHSFDSTDGNNPFGGIIQATDGNFYGTTQYGGANNSGTFFRLATGLSPFVKTLPTLGGVGTSVIILGTSLTDATGVNFNGIAATFTVVSDFEITTTVPVGATTGSVQVTTPISTLLSNVAFNIQLSDSLPVINPNGIVSGASFQVGIAPNSWITILGNDLALQTDNWASVMVNGSLPTILDTVSVDVNGQAAYIAYISPTQINALAPNVGPGTLSVTITNSSGTSSAVTVVSQAFQPAFFQWGNFAVATREDYSFAVKNGSIPGLTTVPAKPGEIIILWGTGFGPTSPPAPTGVVVPSGTVYYSSSNVTVTVGGIMATVYGAALSPGYAGLYQVAIQIPFSLANGDYSVIATVSGAQSPSGTLITVEN